jgi:hypothetical protein
VSAVRGWVLAERCSQSGVQYVCACGGAEHEREYEYGHEPEPERVDWVGLRHSLSTSLSPSSSLSLRAHSCVRLTCMCHWAFEVRRGFFSFFIFSRLRCLAFSRSGVLLYPCTYTRPSAGILSFGRTRPAALPVSGNRSTRLPLGTGFYAMKDY